MEAIANKYLDSNNPFLFPIITKEDGTERKQYLNKMMLINRYLKKIAELAKNPYPTDHVRGPAFLGEYRPIEKCTYAGYQSWYGA